MTALSPQEQADACLSVLNQAVSILPKDRDHMTWAIEFVGRSYDAIEGDAFCDKLRIMAMGVPFHREVFEGAIRQLQPAATPQ